ncbi:M20 family metallo-hydrolase [Rhodobacteraceae bacterium 2376]|uniref:M20 family metallo-hydrolase n=1 Tax=Rhabdonatronobacter sediminivivens TaxID=2743469 RepID=A0A7Z0HZN3_9RHOB|nr:M20 family metallo-hydrolase [Rhabdonatronobacter sediminivivens]NYS25227.1 M20 family metallo-hydrolase [Rhabdonatronobacter sediminivivens]
MPPIPVNPDRLLAELDHLRTIGAVGTGVARIAFSAEDITARRWLAERMAAAGLEVTVDACGNLFGLPPGDAPCLLVGSHSDTQPLGGWLDGIYGVVCGLELARAALETGGSRIAVVSFQDEEGRFGGLGGSAVWAGRMTLAEADETVDAEGVRFGDARQAAAQIGPMGDMPPARFSAYVEPHIEQGPGLEAAGLALGVVEAIVGVRRWSFTFTGQANHAGTTPMALRRDAVQALGQYIHELNGVFAPLVTERTVWTLGRITVDPNAPSIVPGAATVSVQMRDAEAARLDAMRDAALELAQRVAAQRGLQLATEEGLKLDPVRMDEALVDRLAAGAEAVAPGRWQRLPSGALHDACNVSAVVPSAMLFVPSIGGISHNPAEDTARADLRTGLLALASALG